MIARSMNAYWLRLLAVIFGLAMWLYILSFGWAPVPALGPMFEVRGGVWEHRPQIISDQKLLGLRESVTVTFDQHGVPHLFAQNESDLYLVQGFLSASQRLFQLDINTRQTAGRLSELYGEKALPFDEFFTRLGMRQSAAQTETKYREDAETSRMIDSYTAGINLYIEQLKDVPAEYKILGARPEKFTAVRVMNMGKALTWGLAGRSFDPALTKYQQKIGGEAVLDLFPEFVPLKFEDFVMPQGAHHPHAPEVAPGFVSALKEIPQFPLPNPGKGSNNWAVGPGRSASGTSLLANDTHLTLTLPSTWYEAQMWTPDFNVYGVGLVGVPGLVNGFNKDIAWGPTNGTTDVFDFFEVEFEDENSWRYLYRGEWLEAKVTRERIAIKPFGEEMVDVVETKLGNLLHREGRIGLVADWAGHRTRHELRALRKQYTARTAAECLRNFDDWIVPIQNWLCVDKKNIGLRHAGYVPQRAVGEGRFVMDGRTHEPTLQRELGRVLQVFNPAEGFVLSANQKILPPGHLEYLGWDYEPPFRGMSIRRGLKSKAKHTAKDIIDLQNDNLDLQAALALPLLLRAMEGRSSPWLERLRVWDHRIRATQAEPVVFKSWWLSLKEEIFADELGDDEKPLRPKDGRVLWLLDRLLANPQDADARWLNGRTLNEVVSVALDKALAKVADRLGEDESAWRWREWNAVRFAHAGRLPGFGSEVLPMDGSSETIRGVGATHGPVYKIVVETGDWPRAWIQVPGGNEGDPFHNNFGRFVKEWNAGEMRPVEYYHDLDEARQKAARVVVFSPAEGA